MRTEKEMFDLIINTAMEDDRIRAVIMNGSRANPKAPRDIFMDFDIVYLVTDPVPFHKNLEWIKRFGELMILQMPEEMQDPPPDADGRFGYLMQFMDGNRIDLGIFPLSMLREVLQDDLSVVLLDKDGIIPTLDITSEDVFFPKPPSAKAYADCCNEFWWVNPYVAKGLWRNEILYALYMLNDVIRVQLMKMLTWEIGIDTDFSKNPGKFGKYMQQYLSAETWDQLLRTYPRAERDDIWQALFTMGDLFRDAALHVGDHYGYHYPIRDDQSVTAHLHHVQVLPADALEIY